MARGRGTVLGGVRNKLTKAYINRRYGRVQPHGSLTTPGKVKSIQPHERGITVQSENGAIRLTMIAPDCIQVRLQPSGKFPVPFSYSVAKVTWADVKFSVIEADETYALQGPEIACRINRLTSELTFVNVQGHVISQDAEPLAWRENEVRFSRQLPTDESCFGLAAQPTTLDLRGRRYVLWNAEPHRVERNVTPVYFTVPFYLGVHKDFAMGLFWDNPSRGNVDLGAQNKDSMSIMATAGELRYYIFAGPDYFSVLRRYREVTGSLPLPPIWALGLHLSRQSYTSAEQVREIAATLRKNNISCDAIYLDIEAMDAQKTFTWNPQKYPAPAVLITELAEQGFKTIATVHPAISTDVGYKVYENGTRDDVFIKYPGGRPVIVPALPGNAVFPDFTSPKSRAWWSAQFEVLLRPGVDGISNILGEPTIASSVGGQNTLPDAAHHEFENVNTNHAEAHNVYSLLMTRASREALEKAHPGKRPFNLTRTAYAGTQRYGATALTGHRANWDHLRLVIGQVLNAGLSGLPFVGPDAGAFYDNPDPELYMRSLQLASVLPLFRIHSGPGTSAREPWALGHANEDMARKIIGWRYQILPYLYSLFAQCSQQGWPILRPLFTLDPQDNQLRRVDDAFLLGESLLIAPVLDKGKTTRDIYLPRGRWYDYHTNRAYQGGQTVSIPAPLDYLPMLARAGQVIPLWPSQAFVGQQVMTELRLRVYAGNSEVTLYEDAGEGNNYQSGEYRWLYFTCKIPPMGGLSVDWRRAGKYKPPYEHVRCEVIGIDFEPKNVQIDGASAPLWYYENGVVEFTANKPFENARIIEADKPSGEQTLMRSPFKDR